MNKGKLYLIPVPLGDENQADWEAVPQYVIQKIHELDTFIVERARTARRFISPTRPPIPIQDMTFLELDKRNPSLHISEYLSPISQGKDIGLMSEAGCPGVADPGALVVAKAHELGIEVVPMVGPSSLLLALMASGMDGQRFCFHGYLPVKSPERIKAIRKLEQASKQRKETQIFIETPYRNAALFADFISTLSAHTRLCVAADLTLPSQFIQTKSIAEWKKNPPPSIEKRPAVFLLQY